MPSDIQYEVPFYYISCHIGGQYLDPITDALFSAYQYWRRLMMTAAEFTVSLGNTMGNECLCDDASLASLPEISGIILHSREI